MKCIKGYFLALLVTLSINLSAYAGDDPVVTYKFENVLLINALNSLIYTHHIPIVYLKNQVDSVFITEQCSNCNPEEALKKLLKNSVLQYKKVNNQFILFNPKRNNSDPKKKELRIEGIVIDSLTQEPLPYASIVIERMSKGATSNDLGVFKIDNLPPDLYKLKILYVGYTTDSIIADLRTPQKNRFLDIKLSSKNSELDAVVIKTNTLKKVIATSDANTSTIDPKLLKTMPTPDPGDIVQNIKLLPGVSALPDNLGGFNLRGGTMDQTLVQIDGIPLFHPGHLWGFNSSLNADAIESVMIQSGGFSASYGDRLSGVIDMKGRSAGNDGIHAGLFANLFSAKAYVASPISKKASLFLSINSSNNFTGLNSKILNREDYMFFNQYYGLSYENSVTQTQAIALGNTTPYEQKTVTDYYDIFGKFNIQLSKNDSLSVSFIVNSDVIKNSSKINSKVFDGDTEASRTERWETKGLAFSNSHNWSNSAKTDIGFMLSAYTNTTNFFYSSIEINDSLKTNMNFANANTSSIQLVKIYSNSRIQFTNNYCASFGFEFNRFQSEILNKSNDWNNSSIDKKPDLKTFSNNTTSNEFNGFIENNLTILQQLKLSLGTRLTYNKLISKFLAEPRVNSKIDFGKGFSALASWGMYHQNFHCSPSSIAFNTSSLSSGNVWIMSQKGLNPSRSQHWLAGMELSTRKISISLSAYSKNYTDLAFFIPIATEFTKIDGQDPAAYEKYNSWLSNRKYFTSNHDKPEWYEHYSNNIDYFAGSGYSKGIELFISKKYGFHTGFISYNVSKTRYKFPYINMGKEFTANYDRTHELKVLNSLTWHGWNLSGIYTIVSGKPYPAQFMVKNYYNGNAVLFLDHPLKWDLTKSQRTPVYQTFDLSFSKKIDHFKHVKLLMGVIMYNLFNKQNVLGKYYTMTNNIVSDNNSIANFWAVIDPNLHDQKSPGRLFNVFVNIEF